VTPLTYLVDWLALTAALLALRGLVLLVRNPALPVQVGEFLWRGFLEGAVLAWVLPASVAMTRAGLDPINCCLLAAVLMLLAVRRAGRRRQARRQVPGSAPAGALIAVRPVNDPRSAWLS
jgi:hypothetical protein